MSEGKKGFFKRLKDGLARTRDHFLKKLDQVLFGRVVDEALLEELEACLITADFGIETSQSLIAASKKRMGRSTEAGHFRDALKEEIRERLQSRQHAVEIRHKPHVILVVGVNGVGKTTTIGKLAAQFRKEGKKVVIAAGDTFRAAAVEQLATWAERSGAILISQGSHSDSASVIFDALAAGQARGADVVIADTAGRLHTKVNLMEELKKIVRVMKRQDENAPHEVLLVLDATTGQNALNQAKQFSEAVGVTGLVVTKLDGTAKGGVVVAVCDRFGLPIRFIGVGEGLEDLRPFDADAFAEALFSGE